MDVILAAAWRLVVHPSALVSSSLSVRPDPSNSAACAGEGAQVVGVDLVLTLAPALTNCITLGKEQVSLKAPLSSTENEGE